MRHTIYSFAWVPGIVIFSAISAGTLAFSFADEKENSSRAALDSMTGDWTTFPREKVDSGTGQNWQIKWNKKSKYLDYHVETISKNEVAYEGNGFILYDPELDTYRIYLMMDNGALHESVGKKTGTDSFEFRVTTYGVPNAVFPDQSYKLRVTPNEMIGEYAVIKEGGAIDSSSIARIRLWRRDRR